MLWWVLVLTQTVSLTGEANTTLEAALAPTQDGRAKDGTGTTELAAL